MQETNNKISERSCGKYGDIFVAFETNLRPCSACQRAFCVPRSAEKGEPGWHRTNTTEEKRARKKGQQLRLRRGKHRAKLGKGEKIKTCARKARGFNPIGALHLPARRSHATSPVTTYGGVACRRTSPIPSCVAAQSCSAHIHTHTTIIILFLHVRYIRKQYNTRMNALQPRPSRKFKPATTNAIGYVTSTV